VDGITWAEYEIGLEGRIIDLHGRVHRGAYFNYYAVPGNVESLSLFRHRLFRLWGQALRRRNQGPGPPIARRIALGEQWLPYPHALHPFPERRFAAIHPR
jgi:hypothetical protein